MALILNIDTALEESIISLSRGENILSFIRGKEQKQNTALLHPSINKMLSDLKLSLGHLKAVAVVAGPGSYTGLRVGVAAAKGLCYALRLPLIAINSLELLTLNQLRIRHDQNALYCPMIDARRMEVYLSMYDSLLKEIISPTASILSANSLSEFLEKGSVIFFGSGSAKFRDIVTSPNAVFEFDPLQPVTMSIMSFQKYRQKCFIDPIHFTPLYIKEFHTNNSPQTS